VERSDNGREAIRRNRLNLVDSSARAAICEAIDGHLNDQLSAFAFDERLARIRSETKDPTALFVIEQLWYFYDDCDDHLVCLEKQSWDTIQRLRLLLESRALPDSHRLHLLD
jgi:hypothetical protein